jgi:hypothetical protein
MKKYILLLSNLSLALINFIVMHNFDINCFVGGFITGVTMCMIIDWMED